MAKTDYKTESKPSKLALYQAEYSNWLGVLSAYHTNRFNRNYEQYTAYTRTKGTVSRISDPVAPELVERVIQKMFSRLPKFHVSSTGYTLPKEVNQIISSLIENFLTNNKKVQSTGTFRSFEKLAGREFCVTGQVATETFYNTKSDTPDVRIIPVEDVIFNPSETFKTASVYYIRQFVSLDYLESLAEITEKGEVVSGLFKKEAIDKLKKKYADKHGSNKTDPSSNQIHRSGSSDIQGYVDPIELVSRWEGEKLCQIADWEVIVRETEDPMQLEDDPLDFAMDIEIPKEPYAFGILDFINGLTQAKDLFLNQAIDYGAKALNPPLFVDPSIAPINRATLRNAWKVGGLVFAPPSQVTHLPMPPLDRSAFSLLEYMQQRSESVTGVGAYVGGVPNQTSDKTNGTKGGIEALISQSYSPITDRQLNIEESLIEPIVNKMLKMAGALMGKDETKTILISGVQEKWVKVTKGLLTGKITLNDMLVSELITPQEAQEISISLMLQGKNPENEIIIDTDWIIKVEAGSMADQDTQKEIDALNTWVAFNDAHGIPMKLQKVSEELGIKAGIKEPLEYIETQPQGMPGIQGGQPMEQPMGQMEPQQMQPVPQSALTQQPQM